MRSDLTQFIRTFSDPTFAVHIVVGGFKRIVEVVRVMSINVGCA